MRSLAKMADYLLYRNMNICYIRLRSNCINPLQAMMTGWLNIGGVWYYMGPSGAMVTGGQQNGGGWYYFNASGAMATG